MKFKYTILYVEDVTKTIEFYERAFNFKSLMVHESGDYGELDTGETTLSFSSLKLLTEMGKKPVRANAAAPCFEIAFETDNVEEAFNTAIDKGATKIQQPENMPWGQTVAYVADNNGFLVEICSPVIPQE